MYSSWNATDLILSATFCRLAEYNLETNYSCTIKNKAVIDLHPGSNNSFQKFVVIVFPKCCVCDHCHDDINRYLRKEQIPSCSCLTMDPSIDENKVNEDHHYHYHEELNRFWQCAAKHACFHEHEQDDALWQWQ